MSGRYHCEVGWLVGRVPVQLDGIKAPIVAVRIFDCKRHRSRAFVFQICCLNLLNRKMIGVEVFEINCVVSAVCRNRAVGVVVFLNFGTLKALPWRRCLALPFVQMGRSEIVVTMRDLPGIVHYEREVRLH